jgi:hypothetical protein
MHRSFGTLIAVIALLACAPAESAIAKSSPTAPQAKSSPTAPQVSFARFALSGGTADANVSQAGGALTLTSGTDGYWHSASQDAQFDFDELIASWNATTPTDTWITIEMRATGSGRTTKWYTMGIWTSDPVSAHRTSVPAQGDADGFIAIDTFVRSRKAATLRAYELKIGLHRTGTTPTPTVRFVSAMTSAAVAKYEMPSPSAGEIGPLDVPRYSQEIHKGHFPEYDNGGEAWCSPTSTAMILDFWGAGPTETELAIFPATGELDGQVDYAARAVYDWNYQGAGNWPFNTAYAGSRGLNGFVTRLRSLTEAELFIRAGIPLVASVNGRLPGSFFEKSSGHLLTIVGFTAGGDVVSNDPFAPSDPEVRLTYGREDFEQVWLGGSGGVVYVIYPNGVSLPPNVAGTPNW